MVILGVDVVDTEVFLLMMEIASSVNIVGDLSTLKISVGTSMDA